MEKILLSLVFTIIAGSASAGQIQCDVTMVGEKISPVKTIVFTESGQVSVSADPTELMLNNGEVVTVTNENGVIVCRVE